MRVLKQTPARSSSSAWRGLSASRRNCQRVVKPWGRIASSSGPSPGAASGQDAPVWASAVASCLTLLDLYSQKMRPGFIGKR